jgi:hypothetical protein
MVSTEAHEQIQHSAVPAERIYICNLFYGFDTEHCTDSLECRVRYRIDYGTPRARWRGDQPVVEVIAVEQRERHYGGEPYWSALNLPDAMYEKLVMKIEQEEQL